MIYILTVLYNTKMNNCTVYAQHNFSKELKFVFIDNSTNVQIKKMNLAFVQNHNSDFIYVDMQGNKGLSKAYNKAIEIINPAENDYLIILDQDTVFDSNIFTKYISYIENNTNIDVICPIVEDSIGVMSPSFISGVNNKHIFNVNEIDKSRINEFSFINSGMCVKCSVFSEFRYNEDLFLDFVDHDFVRQIKLKNKLIGICFEIVLKQNFSGVTKNSFEQDFNRFKIFIKDAKVYYSKYFPKKNFKIILLKRTLKLTLIHRKIDFIKNLIKLK